MPQRMLALQEEGMSAVPLERARHVLAHDPKAGGEKKPAQQEDAGHDASQQKGTDAGSVCVHSGTRPSKCPHIPDQRTRAAGEIHGRWFSHALNLRNAEPKGVSGGQGLASCRVNTCIHDF